MDNELFIDAFKLWGFMMPLHCCCLKFLRDDCSDSDYLVLLAGQWRNSDYGCLMVVVWIRLVVSYSTSIWITVLGDGLATG
jgi:hypothetical protein